MMDREGVEQLVSAWLDDPQDGELRARLDAAVARDPQFARLCEQYQRLDRLVRDTAAGLPPVAWERVAARILAGIDRVAAPEAADARLDARLRSTSEIETRVDWQALSRKIGQAIDRQAARPRTWRVPWRVSVAAGLLAAAAALALMVGFPSERRTRGEPQGPAGHVRVHVLSAAGPASPSEPRTGVVRVMVIEDTDFDPGDPPGAADAVPADRSAPELYFMLEAPEVALAVRSANES